MSGLSVRDLARAAVSIALIAICSWISIPTVIPFTLQTFAVCLTAALLGPRTGTAAVAAYILLGALGVPVFSGFRGGPGVLLGPTGGYILGFVLTALVVGLAARRWQDSWLPLLLAMAAGILLCYAFGTVWFMLVYSAPSGPVSLGTALSLCVLPYLIPDAVKAGLAVFLARRLRGRI